MIEKHIAQGAPVEGIGFQSRIKQGLITPDTIYKRLCDFDYFNLPYQATEFEIRDDAVSYVYTDEERKLLTEYMTVMYFSHPKVNGFWHWTFSDTKSNEMLDYPLFNYDGTPKVNGEMWIELMEGFFNTNLVTTTNIYGEAFVCGYYGSYVLETEIEGKKYHGTFQLDSLNANSVVIVNLEGGINTSGLDIKKKNKIRIGTSQVNTIVVRMDAEMFPANQFEIHFFDMQGRMIYKQELTAHITLISKSNLNDRGFFIAAIKEVKSGKNLAVEKIIIM